MWSSAGQYRPATAVTSVLLLSVMTDKVDIFLWREDLTPLLTIPKQGTVLGEFQLAFVICIIILPLVRTSASTLSPYSLRVCRHTVRIYALARFGTTIRSV
jgi:hypothetical protein